MLRYEIMEQALQSSVELLNMLKITKSQCSSQSFSRQEEIVLYPILKIQCEVFNQIVNEWIIMLKQIVM